MSFADAYEMVSMHTAHIKTPKSADTKTLPTDTKTLDTTAKPATTLTYTSSLIQKPLNEPVLPLHTATKSTGSFTPSLRSIGKPKPNEAVIEVTTPTFKKVFTINQLHDTMHEFAQLMQQQNKRNLAFTLQTHQAQLISETDIVFEVQNATQAEEINQQKVSLLQHLKSKLKNDFITVTAKINAEVETGKSLYTPADKFAEMALKNPTLLKFKSAFDFDL